MHQADLFLLFTAPLDRGKLSYMVTGSVASMAYGEPRLTNDIDIVIDLPARAVPRICESFPLSEFYCPPEEVLVVEANRSSRGHFNIIHHKTGHKADIYTRGTDPLQAWGLEHRSWLAFPEEHGLWLAPPEYVIVRKLEYFREGGSEKHLHDIEGMLNASKEQLDFEVLDNWIKHFNLGVIWKKIQASL